MTTDPKIREQGYQYFRQEAPELLRVLEQGLLTLHDDHSINKINTLMRATHTLKGAASSIQLETIETVAHSLEDVFRVLCRPDIDLKPDVEALLFEGFECLRLALQAELADTTINHAEILDRIATIFAQLQESLGDFFAQEARLPSSAELGFDITQSIFEVGVAQRLEHLTETLKSHQPAEKVATTLRSIAEVFWGLGESLNLPGFGAIAQMTLIALERHPDQALTIAQRALSDFQAGHAAVMTGDRTQGGYPSADLLALVEADPLNEMSDPLLDPLPLAVSDGGEGGGSSDSLIDTFDWSDLPNQAIATEPADDSALDSVDLDPLSDSISDSIFDDEASLPPDDSLLIDLTINPSDSVAAEDTRLSPRLSTPPPEDAEPIYPIYPLKPVPTQAHSTKAASPNPTPIPKPSPTVSPVVRVQLKHLNQLNYAVGELLTQQNQQSLQSDQLRTAVQTLYARLRHHSHLLNQLHDWAEQQFMLPQQRQIESELTDRLDLQDFDPLELDRYSEPQLLIQSLLDDTVQLTEAADAIDLFSRQSSQIQDQQRRLLTHTRDALIEARMVPLGLLLERFPQVLQQLETLHKKQVSLSLRGTDVLVDKVVAEQLYEPLLHLVRNAFDHGIEVAALRQSRSKPEIGHIVISAHHQGKYLIVDVQDDGQGLDYDRIRQRVAQLQWVPLEQIDHLTTQQLTAFLFEPGFSTASQVSNLSGRGVGLDVVQSQIQALEGEVLVASVAEGGTTFTLKIPLSLTIAKLLICEAGARTYALLPDAIEQIVVPLPNQIQQREQCKVLRWGGANGQLVPIYPLASLLPYSAGLAELPTHPLPKTGDDARSLVALVRHNEQLIGLEVDRMLEDQELVIRPLHDLVNAPTYAYGASILAEGHLVLVLDATALVQRRFEQPSQPQPQPQPQTRTNYGARSLPAEASVRPEPSMAESLSKAPSRILLVDDSVTARQTLAMTLQKVGYQVLQATDGEDGFNQLKRHPHIGLVICDIEMPRMNGFEFLRRCQQEPLLAGIPVVMLSSRSGDKHRLLAEQLGAIAYLSKPYLEHKLLEVVGHLLQTKPLNSISGERR